MQLGVQSSLRFIRGILKHALPLGAALASVAYANDRGISHSEIRQQRAAAAIIKSTHEMKGTLSCPIAEMNAGQACALRFTDAGSGAVFRLNEEGRARKLIADGTTRVVVRGEIMDSDLISIESIQVR